MGTGTEDYIGTGWGQGAYAHRFQGCLIADAERDEWAFYRYHVPDPVYFASDCSGDDPADRRQPEGRR